MEESHLPDLPPLSNKKMARLHRQWGWSTKKLHVKQCKICQEYNR